MWKPITYHQHNNNTTEIKFASEKGGNMVYTCEKCGKVSKVAYKSSDGKYKTLCSLCVAEYEHELEKKKELENEPNLEAKMEKNFKNVSKILNYIKKRCGEIETKNGDLQKRIEYIEQNLGIGDE